VEQMRAGPSEPAVRRRLQATASCDGQKSVVVSVAAKGGT